VFVDIACEAGPDAWKTSSSIRLDYEYAKYIADVHGSPVCGDWHSHGPGGLPFPSSGDRAGWSGMLDALNLTAYASIIIEEVGVSGRPRGYATYKRNGRTITLPALVIEED
jgi:proteasome lid subunit RPN8/RPN11